MTHPLMKTEHDKTRVLKTTRLLDIIFESEDVATEYAEMLDAVLVPESFELGMSIFEPELIRYSFPLLLERLAEKNLQSAANLLFTIENMVGSVSIPDTDKDYYEIRVSSEIETTPIECLFAAFVANLPQEIRESVVEAVGNLTGYKSVSTAITTNGLSDLFDRLRGRGKQVKEKPLDLSEVETPKEDSCINLAKSLSQVLTNPKCPEKLYNVIQDEIGMLNQPKEYFSSAEYLARVLCANDEVSE